MPLKRILAVSILLFIGCQPRSVPAVRLATTTSIDNSGLLQHLGQRFLEQTGIRLEPLVVGSGKALDLARKGEVSIALTHEPRGERELLGSGRVAAQSPFLTNRFLLVGPAEDPAGIAAYPGVVEAMVALHRARGRFVSRGDDSGTHVRELDLWDRGGIDPHTNPGYQSLGQGMSALLRSASELEAYTLTDEATFARLRNSVRLRPIVRTGEGLTNVYTISLITERRGGVDANAKVFYEWILSDAGRRAAETFTIEGAPVFRPATPAEPFERPPIVVP